MWGHPNSLCFLYSVYKSDMSSLLGAKLTVAGGKTLVLVSFPSSLKDGAYYCYCAYILRILRYSVFLSVMLTNTGIFLRGLKLSGESRS